MRIGLQLTVFDWPGGTPELSPRLAEIARIAEDAGFASLWIMDHFFQLPAWGRIESSVPESYTTLGYLAAITKNIHLGTLVAGVNYRYPGILVKMASTLDVLSSGRYYFGIGAGWYEREAHGLGAPFPPLAERFERLEETLQIAKQMWSEQVKPYQGKYYHLAEPHNHPQPLTRPHPPIMIGGNGEKRTLRLVAQYADACNLLGLPPETTREKLESLKRFCEEVNRPYHEIEKTALHELYRTPDMMTVSDIIGLCRSLADAGIEHLIVNMPNVHELKPLEIFGREIIPLVAEF